MNSAFRKKVHKVDFCVVGGGMAGICAAIAAARNGAKVAIMQDRPMFGGNASSEIRMWVGGAGGSNKRETGIIEEIILENAYRNPYKIYSIWDSVLYEKVKMEENIKVFLNCSCNDAQMCGNKIKSITGWQLTTQTYHIIEADYFADCSGDSVLAPITGAEFRMGREAKSEFNEDIGHEEADKHTMGNSCLIQAREMNEKRDYIPPKWAYKFTDDMLEHRMPDLKSSGENYWYMEVGGMDDTIHDAEEIRDELLKIAFGMWDFIKTHKECNAENWELDWVGFLPGKRESRRYVGDHILSQKEVTAEGKFDDLVAYGGWPMDDHPPQGLYYKGKPTTYHNSPSPYGIPYRCMYSKNVENLYFAGRNISVTHMALSSTRVMATCAVIGQAVGTAAAMAVKYNLSPREVYEQKIDELKQNIMDDDGYLPFNIRNVSDITKTATLIGRDETVELLRNGVDRPIGEEINCYSANLNEVIEYRFDDVKKINGVRIVFDSDLDRVTIVDTPHERTFPTRCNIRFGQKAINLPKTIVKAFDIEISKDGTNWENIHSVKNNYQRLVKLPISREIKAIRLIPKSTWGEEKANIFDFEVF